MFLGVLSVICNSTRCSPRPSCIVDHVLIFGFWLIERCHVSGRSLNLFFVTVGGSLDRENPAFEEGYKIGFLNVVVFFSHSLFVDYRLHYFLSSAGAL